MNPRFRISLVGLLVAALCVLPIGRAAATDDPHGAGTSIACGECHISHGSLGEILIDSADPLVATLCLSCHSPGGWVGMTMELSSADQAVPGSEGTSHRWDSHAVSVPYGADVPQSATLFEHLSADSTVTCATCHDPHSNSNPPFLRLDNSADALCLDCHAPRNMSSARTWTGGTLSHPVGVTLPSSSAYHSPPLDVDGNPQPSDGNLTNDLILSSGAVVCTTCHGIHYADSNSGTVDGP